jgi:hypothetical protein
MAPLQPLPTNNVISKLTDSPLVRDLCCANALIQRQAPPHGPQTTDNMNLLITLKCYDLLAGTPVRHFRVSEFDPPVYRKFFTVSGKKTFPNQPLKLGNSENSPNTLAQP